MEQENTIDVSTASETELRDAKVPWIKDREELMAYIDKLAERPQDYGTCVYSMSMAATAAFNYIASRVGASGFQASCADLDVLRRTRHWDRFCVLNLEDAIYPQSDLRVKLDEYLAKNADYLRDKAREQLDKYGDEEYIHPDVRAHWEKLANA